MRVCGISHQLGVRSSSPPARSGREGVSKPFSESRGGNTLLMIAPRGQAFDDVERLVRRAGWNVARRTELRVDAEPRNDVVILDTIGELAQVFQVGTVVFVGGSLVDAGGHNILEPAVFGKPIVFGPHMDNFAEIARTFLDNGAAIQVRSGRELESTLLALLNDPVRRASLGARHGRSSEPIRGARGKSLAVLASSCRRDGRQRQAFRIVH
jgi:3-deoxy-D-manno-octulosonic-acid transferase